MTQERIFFAILIVGFLITVGVALSPVSWGWVATSGLATVLAALLYVGKCFASIEVFK